MAHTSHLRWNRLKLEMQEMVDTIALLTLYAFWFVALPFSEVDPEHCTTWPTWPDCRWPERTGTPNSKQWWKGRRSIPHSPGRARPIHGRPWQCWGISEVNAWPQFNTFQFSFRVQEYPYSPLRYKGHTSVAWHMNGLKCPLKMRAPLRKVHGILNCTSESNILQSCCHPG